MMITRKWAAGPLRAMLCAGMAVGFVASGASADPPAQIEAEYQRMGGATGVLGSPFHVARKSTDDQGWYRTYEQGVIYWHPATGAHEVHGAIRKLWAAVGCEKGYLGYPISDVADLPRGAGHVSRFQYGRIEWQPGSGQVAVVYSEPAPLASATGIEELICGDSGEDEAEAAAPADEN